MQIHDITGKKEEKLTFSDEQSHLVFLYNTSTSLTVELKSPKTEVKIIGLFTPTKKEEFKVKTIQKHTVGENNSDLLIKTALFDQSRFEYEGLIRIEKGAHKSHAYQKNQNLILSKDAYVDSSPFLEILADDVFCTHGSTTGKLNKDQLFFAETRGLKPKKAQKMLIEGFFEDVLSQLEQIDSNLAEKYRAKINADIQSVLQ